MTFSTKRKDGNGMYNKVIPNVEYHALALAEHTRTHGRASRSRHRMQHDNSNDSVVAANSRGLYASTS